MRAGGFARQKGVGMGRFYQPFHVFFNMKKFLKFFPVLFAVMLTGLVTTSCGDDDEDDVPAGVVGHITIKNSSKYELDDFVVNFINDDLELITRERKGTLKCNASCQVDIPIGATKYYMGTSQGGKMFWSANYDISIRSQVLTDQSVGNWSSNN